jgi:phage-related protein
MNTYQQDYNKSREFELEFEQMLQTHYKMKTEISDSTKSEPEYDISTTATTGSNKGRVVKFEVKYSAHEENVFIEDGRKINETIHPCGLTLCQAEYYCFNFKSEPDYFYLVKTSFLKDQIKQNRCDVRWDKKGYRLYIMAKSYIINNSTWIKKTK